MNQSPGVETNLRTRSLRCVESGFIEFCSAPGCKALTTAPGVTHGLRKLTDINSQYTHFLLLKNLK